MLLRDDSQVYAFTRTHGSDGLVLIANWSDDPCAREVPAFPSSAVTLVHNYPQPPALAQSLQLRPWEVVVYRWQG